MMVGPRAKRSVLYGGAGASVICCALLVWWSALVDIDAELEEGCHRALAKSTPFDIREIATLGYDDNDSQVGIAHGRLDKQISSLRWEEVAWTCRFNSKNGQVIRAEISELQGVHNLKAAAAPFNSKR